MRVTAITEDLRPRRSSSPPASSRAPWQRARRIRSSDPRGAFKRDPESFRFLGPDLSKLKTRRLDRAPQRGDARVLQHALPHVAERQQLAVHRARALDRVHTFPACIRGGREPDRHRGRRRADTHASVASTSSISPPHVRRGAHGKWAFRKAEQARVASSLITQFLGEALAQVLLAAAIATATGGMAATARSITQSPIRTPRSNTGAIPHWPRQCSPASRR